MNNLLKEILNSMDTIDGWHILKKEIESNELFYIKEDVDMNRLKKVQHFVVTVYKDFEIDGEKYKGSSVAIIAPTMEKEEIIDAFKDAAYAATFVKNQHYPLISGKKLDTVIMPSNLAEKPLHAWLPEFTAAIFKSNIKEKNALNSAELFLNKNKYSISNSEGVEVSYENHDVHIEFITNWTGEKEEVESFKNMNLAAYAPEAISEEIRSMIEITKEKSTATPTPSLNGIDVLLTGGPVQEFFSYYVGHSSSKGVYDQISTFKIDDSMQGQAKGDKITLTLDPNLSNSSFSKPYDADGLPLEKTTIVESGILKHYWGTSRYAHYLDIKAVGSIKNMIVDAGSKTIKEMKAKPHIELVEFSDFQMDGLTGNFAGEIRLARYFDGEKTIPVTTGSVSGNIKDVQEEMYFSKEIYQANEYLGPKTIQLLNLNIAGN